MDFNTKFELKAKPFLLAILNMLPTRYWISARAIPKQVSLPLVKKVKSLPQPKVQPVDTQQKEVIAQFVLTEDGTPVLIHTEVYTLTK